MSLNLFPARVPIGRATISGQSVDVLMTPEFSRALSDLLERVGGTSSPSLTTVVNNLGDVTNIVNDISGSESFSGMPAVDLAATPAGYFFSAPTTTEADEKIDFVAATDCSSAQQIEELRILLTAAVNVVAEMTELSKSLQAFAIQSVFVSAPPSPISLAPDATDLPTVITLANSLKNALLSNGIGS